MNRKCAIYQTTSFLGKKWTIPLILEIYKGKEDKGFNQLKRNLPGITPKILSSRLKELEKKDLVNKKLHDKNLPLKSEYSLTNPGRDFIKIIKKIKNWAFKWNLADNKECQSTDCRYCQI